MNKKEMMYEKIEKHGRAVARFFFMDEKGKEGHFSIDYVKLSKQLLSLESKAHKIAEDYCNGTFSGDFEKEDEKIERKLCSILMIHYCGREVFFNSDPRGYALKIKSEKAHDFYFKDWGGYGILAPDFRDLN
jgi:hypothetical protein